MSIWKTSLLICALAGTTFAQADVNDVRSCET